MPDHERRVRYRSAVLAFLAADPRVGGRGHPGAGESRSATDSAASLLPWVGNQQPLTERARVVAERCQRECLAIGLIGVLPAVLCRLAGAVEFGRDSDLVC